jgi:multidrug resistance protein, MATE family
MTDQVEKANSGLQARAGHSVGEIIAANAAAISAQILVALSGFMETYFVASLGIGPLAQFSYVAGFNIIGAALLGGLMQSFLIIGGKNLGEANTAAFGVTLRASFWLALIATLATQTTIMVIIVLQTGFAAPASGGLIGLVLVMAPGLVLSALTLVYRLNALIQRRIGLFIAITATSFVFKLAGFLYFFNYAPGLYGQFPMQLGAALLLTSASSLAVAWFLSRKSAGTDGTPKALSDGVGTADRMRLLFAIGIQIGLVIAVELAVLAGAQLMVWHESPVKGALFGIAVQLILLIETVAVAAGQVTTLLVAVASAEKSVSLARTGQISIAITTVLHSAIATAMFFAAPWIAHTVVPGSTVLSPQDLALLENYIRYAAAAQLLLGMVISMAAVLRGVGDVTSPLTLIALNYLGLGLGLGALLLFATSLRDHGMWIAILVSLLVSCLTLAWRVNGKFREVIIK